METRKLRRYIIRTFFCIFITATGLIGLLYLGRGYIRQGIRNRICSMVIKYEEELSEVVEICHEEGDVYLVREKDVFEKNEFYERKCYEKMNNKAVNEMFDVFDFVYVDCYREEAVNFVVQPSWLGFLWNTWAYGFYYSEDGSPQGVFGHITVIEESENEMNGEGVLPVLGECRYRTERIKDNWWFFESELEEGFIEWEIKRIRNKKYIYW